MATGYEEIVVEEKTPFTERVVEWFCDHPVAGTAAYVGACLVVAIPLCAVYGGFVGRTAGKSAAKMLLEAGVKL